MTTAPATLTATDSAMALPAGQFLWTPAWRNMLPHLRGENPPTLALDRNALLDHSPLLSPCSTEHGHSRQPALPDAWPPEETPARVTRDQLEHGDDTYWHALFATAATPRTLHNDPDWMRSVHLDWAVQACTVVRDLPTALTLYLRVMATNPEYWWHMTSATVQMQRLLSSASDADYRQCLTIARPLADQCESLRATVARIFTTEPDLVDAALDAIEREPEWFGSFKGMTRLSLAQAERVGTALCCAGYYGATDLTATTLNIVNQHDAAALPIALRVLARCDDSDSRKAMLTIVRAFDSEAALAGLIPLLDQKAVRLTIDTWATQYPALALKLLAEHLHTRRSLALDAWLTRLAVAHPQPLEQALGMLDTAPRDYLHGLVTKIAAGHREASAEQLPDILRAPPWLAGKRKSNDKRPALDLVRQTDHMAWPDNLQAAWQKDTRDIAERLDWVARKHADMPLAAGVLHEFGVKTHEQVTDILAGATPATSDFLQPDYAFHHAFFLLALPDNVLPGTWAALPLNGLYDDEQALEHLAARFELAFLPGLLRYIRSNREAGLRIALPFACADIAPQAAQALRRTKKARQPAQHWLLAHAELAAIALLPQASGRPGAAREDADHALRWLADNDRREALDTAAAVYGDDGQALLDAIVQSDPLMLYPDKLPKLPAFFVPRAFSRPCLTTGEALPIPAVEHLGTMLAISAPHAQYAGLARVIDACTPESLADFAWDLFLAWSQSGAPSKQAWAFHTLGWLGNDETARRLAPLIRKWPGESGHARAVTGLEILATIGSDIALMHLNGVAQKIKYKGLQNKAREKIQAIAEARQLTPEELADRLVPDLGLDETGTLRLDFGPRQFLVGFDEQLKPFVRDPQGKRIKTLPRPGKRDDADKAAHATNAFKLLKKDARALATLQIRRFEMAMVEQRRWSTADFRRFLVEHPLLRHLSRRLLWCRYIDDKPATCFRVAEDLSLADRDDADLIVPDDARIGITHALELNADDRAAFGELFADYEILQPFPQLDRETCTLDTDEQASSRLDRFAGKQVATTTMLGLEHRGWRRGEALDGGWTNVVSRYLPDDLQVDIELDPGIIAGDIAYEPMQTLGDVVLRKRGTWDDNGLLPFSRLPPVATSEILRDLTLLS